MSYALLLQLNKLVALKFSTVADSLQIQRVRGCKTWHLHVNPLGPFQKTLCAQTFCKMNIHNWII